MLRPERVLSFIVLGLIMFSPAVPDWSDLLAGRGIWLVLGWLLLIIICAWLPYPSSRPPDRT